MSLLENTPSLATAGLSILLLIVLLRIAVIDIRELRVPDRLSLPLAVAGLAVAWMMSRQPIGAHLAGALGGYAVLAAVGALHFRLRGREGLGLGDAKLFAAAGAWLGWEALPAVLFLAAVLGLLTAGLRRLAGAAAPEIPFAPALAAAFWLGWTFGVPGVPMAWR